MADAGPWFCGCVNAWSFGRLLCDYIERRLIDLSRATTFVLDEADRMLDMGFLHNLRTIKACRSSTSYIRSTLSLADARVQERIEQLN